MPRAATSKGTKPDISFQSEVVIYSNDVCLEVSILERLTVANAYSKGKGEKGMKSNFDETETAYFFTVQSKILLVTYFS